MDERQPEVADELGAAPAHEVVPVAFQDERAGTWPRQQVARRDTSG
ncbi:MAG TPA: hypothetical protein VMV92_42360 [Streptosporangiaceae bacterium]|nr:hypothetical protein [Streptosporangiaceae bacterium]